MPLRQRPFKGKIKTREEYAEEASTQQDSFRPVLLLLLAGASFASMGQMYLEVQPGTSASGGDGGRVEAGSP